MNTGKSKSPPTQLHSAELANYMADMSLQMLKIARGQGFRALEQIFEMAYYESYARANPVEITPEEMEELKALVATSGSKNR